MKKILVLAATLEVSYLTLSFVLALIYGQWSITGEIFRTGLRLISILFYSYIYHNYFNTQNQPVKTKELLTPQFVVALALFILFALLYTNAENETILWQVLFLISGITAGAREELFYRGIVQQSLQKKYAYKTALLLATILFTLSHVQYIYYGQLKGLMLIAFAGAIFGSIFIYSGSIAFTASVHGIYDAILSINISAFRLSNGAALPILFSIMVIFLIILNEKLHSKQATSLS
jgi:membrane protease YdiL (CAAX protease family)